MKEKVTVPEPCEAVETWQDRLSDEAFECYSRLVKLRAALNDESDLKLSKREWDLLADQRNIMEDYFRILNYRCDYYGLKHPRDNKVCNY